MEIKINDTDLPGLYQTANNSSIEEQNKYFKGISCYLILLIIASFLTYFSNGKENFCIMIFSASFFLLALFIMIWLRTSKPDDIWYNGRAVAESVKTRSWRWMMKAEPYIDCENVGIMRTHFLNDLKTILKQNENLFRKLGISASIEDPISEKMINVRKLELNERIEIYKRERILDQALWYNKKSKFNKKRSTIWFVVTVIFHSIAIILLLVNIASPKLKLPIEVVALCASSVLTWGQAKKYNELSSSYSLTAHEIILIKSEVVRIESEETFSEYIINCENAFSREHTQWFAKKNE